ncbi:MAG: aldehyde dehydrogenase family protein, partial [Actinomadura sp.]
MTTIATTNPATGEVERTFDAMTAEEVGRRIARAAEAFASYRTTSIAQRAEWMHAAAGILDGERGRIGAMLTKEMGKTLKAAEAEAAKCAAACRFFADHAAEFLADRRPADPEEVGASDAYVRYEPLGPVLAVMPWNFPLWQVVRFAAPG